MPGAQEDLVVATGVDWNGSFQPWADLLTELGVETEQVLLKQALMDVDLRARTLALIQQRGVPVLSIEDKPFSPGSVLGTLCNVIKQQRLRHHPPA